MASYRRRTGRSGFFYSLSVPTATPSTTTKGMDSSSATRGKTYSSNTPQSLYLTGPCAGVMRMTPSAAPTANAGNATECPFNISRAAETPPATRISVRRAKSCHSSLTFMICLTFGPTSSPHSICPVARFRTPLHILAGTGMPSRARPPTIVRRNTSAHTARRCLSASSASVMIGYLW